MDAALSHQIAALERELGVRLFARTSRRVQLTPAGEAFLPAARASLEAAERAVVDAAAADGQVRGRLSVGIIPTVAAIDVAAVLKRFHTQYPRVRIGLRVGASDEIAGDVRDGSLDIGLLGLPETDQPRNVEVLELARDRLVAVVPTTHPLAHKKRTNLPRLAEETFVDFPAGSPGRMQSDRAFEAAGLSRDVAFEVTTADLITRIVAHGLAIALLPSTFTLEVQGLVAVPVTGGPSRVEYLVWSRFNPSPAANAFLETVRLHRAETTHVGLSSNSTRGTGFPPT